MTAYGRGAYGVGVYGVGEEAVVTPPPPVPETPLPIVGPKPTRFVVEVRDKNLNRLGQILPQDMDFVYEGAHNNVGQWTLELPLEHPMVRALSTPGAGIILFGEDGVIDSGPVVKPEKTITPADPGGTAIFTGVTDNIILADTLAWPVPSSPTIAGQTLSHDVRTGPAETLMHAYVNANIGPAAPLERRGPMARKLVMGPNLGRGPERKKSARFDVLGSLLNEIVLTGNLGFRVVQVGSSLEFQTFLIADRSGTVRLDVRNRTLSGQKTSISAPGVTHVLVAGQGQQEERAFLLASTAKSVAAMNAWGRRIERFVDQRQTDDEDEYLQKANEILQEEGFSEVSLTAVPNDDETPTMRFGVDWGLGDKVTAVIDRVEHDAVVTGVVIKVNSDGTRIAAKLGSTDDSSQTFESRLSALERNAESLTRYDVLEVVKKAVGVSSYKLKDATVKRLGTTLAADDDLWFDLPSDSVHEVEFNLAVSGPGGVRLSLSVPTGAGGAKFVTGPTSAAGAFTDRVNTAGYFGAHGLTFVHLHQVPDVGAAAITVKARISTTTAGRIRLLAAQATSNATPTLVEAASYARLTRIA